MMRTYLAMTIAYRIRRGLALVLILVPLLYVGLTETNAEAMPKRNAPGVCAPSDLNAYTDTAKAQWVDAGYPAGWGEGCAITLAYGDATAACGGKPAAGCAAATKTTCVITIAPNYDTSYTQKIVTHELGHCLGLGHSPSKGSIMYAGGPMTAIRPSDVDSRAIRKAYAGGVPEPKSDPDLKKKPPTTVNEDESSVCNGPKDNWKKCLIN